MKIINAGYEILSSISEGGIDELQHIEKIGRVCYKSEDKITEDGESAKKFVKMLIDRGHEAMIEHSSLSVKFIVDRGVSHELVRHRIASFAQESTRYVDSTKFKGEVNNHEDVIRLYKLGLTAKEISKLKPKLYSPDTIYTILSKANIHKEDQIDYNYFDNIDSSRKAYLLGLIQSDGNVRKNKNSFILTISQNMDEMWYIEALLKEEIGFKIEAISGGREGQQSIQITNNHLVNKLYELGIIPNKTYDQGEEHIEKLWSEIPEKYKWDFIHGLFDGDGCIGFGNQTTSTGKPNGTFYNIAGNKFLLNKIKVFIEKELPNIHVAIDNYDTYSKLRINHTEYIKQLCCKMLSHLEIPFSNPHKTVIILSNVSDVNYKENEFGNSSFKVIKPCFDKWIPSNNKYWVWLQSMYNSERAYTNLRLLGATPQEARSVLPNSTKTEITITANYREWRNFFKLRIAKAAHPQMREVTIPLLKELKERLPIIFDDIEVEE